MPRTFMKSEVNRTLLGVATILFLSSCGLGNDRSNNDNTNYAKSVQQIIDKMEFGVSTLSFNDFILADLSSDTPVVTPYGTFQRGQTLNLFEIDGMELTIYGEDGVFAMECEANAIDSSFGPSHPKCQVVGAENYDKLIVCMARSASASLSWTPKSGPGFPLPLRPTEA